MNDHIRVLWTKRPARLIRKGEQCSEIKWLDTGSFQALANDQIEFGRGSAAVPDVQPARTALPRASVPGQPNDTNQITVLVKNNPKKSTAAMRFAKYKTGMTVAEYKQAVGANQAMLDLRWDVKMQFIKITGERNDQESI
jgi:hypothetical protein